MAGVQDKNMSGPAYKTYCWNVVYLLLITKELQILNDMHVNRLCFTSVDQAQHYGKEQPDVTQTDQD